MSDFRIEKNIPLPPRRNKFDFDSMGVGDSFVIESEDPAEARELSRKARNAAYQYGLKKGSGWRFTLRKEPESGDGFTRYRLWRVDPNYIEQPVKVSRTRARKSK